MCFISAQKIQNGHPGKQNKAKSEKGSLIDSLRLSYCQLVFNLETCTVCHVEVAARSQQEAPVGSSGAAEPDSFCVNAGWMLACVR